MNNEETKFTVKAFNNVNFDTGDEIQSWDFFDSETALREAEELARQSSGSHEVLLFKAFDPQGNELCCLCNRDYINMPDEWFDDNPKYENYR